MLLPELRLWPRPEPPLDPLPIWPRELLLPLPLLLPPRLDERLLPCCF